MAGLGFLAQGLGTGISNFTDSYTQARKMRLQQDAEEKQTAQNDRTFKMQMAEHGLIDNGSGGLIESSEKKNEKALKAITDQAALAKAGYQAVKGSAGDYTLGKIPGFRDTEEEYKKSLIAKNNAEIEQLNGKAGKGKMLPADKVLSVNEGKNITSTIDDVKKVLGANGDTFGPFAGRMGAANPYDTKAQGIDSQMRTASQQFGRYMEGGVLRKEDEEKYRKMFPQLNDTPELAATKLAVVERMLKKKQAADVATLKGSGYNTSGFGEAAEIPDLPQNITGGSGFLNSASAAPADPAIANFAKEHSLNYKTAADIINLRKAQRGGK